MSEHCEVEYQILISQGVNLQIDKRQCLRPVHRDGRCIFHLDDPEKPLEPIIDEIRRQSQSADCKDIDLCYFVFPKDPFRFPIAIRKPVFIEHCKFYGDASFRGLHFPSYTSFHSTEFIGEADFGDDNNIYDKQVHFRDLVIFSSVTFHKKAFFRACVFQAMPEFIGTTFKDIAVFAWANFDITTSPKRWLVFRLCSFQGDTDMGFRFAEPILGMRFAYCDLRGLLITTLPREDVRIEFENINRWDENRRWYQWPRNKIRDETQKVHEPVPVIDCYRYLEKYFYEHSDCNLARHFSIGQLVVMRRDKNYDWLSRQVNRLYQFVSNYGESIGRPVSCLFLSFSIFPLLLLFLGMNVHRGQGEEQKVVWVNYDLIQLVENEDLAYLWSDYKSACGVNFSLSTFDRKHELSPPSDSLQKGILIVETILNLIFASLVVIATRRKFTPKKPPGS